MRGTETPGQLLTFARRVLSGKDFGFHSKTWPSSIPLQSGKHPMAAPMPSWDFYLLAGLPILLTILGLSLQLSKDRKELRRERAYKKAAKDHGLAVRCLRIIVPKLIGSCGVYEEIIPDQDFRERIRTYLGELNPGTLQFEPFQLGSVNTNGHNHVTMRRWNSRKLNTNGSRHTCRCSAATSAFRTSRCSTPSCMSPSMAANGAGYPHGLATGTPSTPA